MNYIVQKVRILVVILPIITSFLGCNMDKESNTTAHNNSIKIDILEAIDHIRPLNIQIKDIITLDSTGLLSEISKVLFHQKKYFILDRKYSCIKVFSQQGTFLFDIGRIGQASFEFLSVEDFLIDENLIHILSIESRKVLIYTTEGKFIDSKKIDFYAFRFVKTKLGFIFYTNFNGSNESGNHNIIFTDTKFSVVNSEFHYQYASTPSFNDTGFLEKNINILFSQPLENNIYCYDTLKNNFYIKYHIISKEKFPNKYLKNLQSVVANLPNFSYLMNPCLNNERFLYFKFVHLSRIYQPIYDITNNALYIGDRDGLLELIHPVGIDSTHFIGSIRMTDFIDRKIKPKFIEKLKVNQPKLLSKLQQMGDKEVDLIVRFTFQN